MDSWSLYLGLGVGGLWALEGFSPSISQKVLHWWEEANWSSRAGKQLSLRPWYLWQDTRAEWGPTQRDSPQGRPWGGHGMVSCPRYLYLTSGCWGVHPQLAAPKTSLTEASFGPGPQNITEILLGVRRLYFININ